MQNNTKYLEKDEIDLRELPSILKKKKKLIWSVTTIFTVLALVYVSVYVSVSKPIYEVKAMIEVGQINNKLIDGVNNIQHKLAYKYHVNVKGKKRELPLVKAISLPKGSSTILSLTIHANSNEEGIKYIQTVINEIETEYKEKTDAYANNQKELIKLTQESIQENIASLTRLKKELDHYSQKIISLKSEDAALAGIYALQIGQKQTELQNLKKYISDLKNKEQGLKHSISPQMMKPTHIVGGIETLAYASKSKKKIIVIIAFITGLMLSIFLALFFESRQGIKREDLE